MQGDAAAAASCLTGCMTSSGKYIVVTSLGRHAPHIAASDEGLDGLPINDEQDRKARWRCAMRDATRRTWSRRNHRAWGRHGQIEVCVARHLGSIHGEYGSMLPERSVAGALGSATASLTWCLRG